MRKKIAITLALWGLMSSIVFPSFAASGQTPVLIGEPSLSGVLTTAQIDAHAAKLGYADVTGKARCDVKVYGLNYLTPDIFGKPSNASGALLVPTGQGCEGPTPLLVYTRGTELDQQYDQSKLDNEGTLRLAEAFAAQGYAVITSDYLGYARSQSHYHPYFSKLIVSSVLDGYRAAQEARALLKLNWSDKVFYSGHSQGGYNIIATVEAIEKNKLPIPVSAVVPQSGISRPSVLYRYQGYDPEDAGLPRFLLPWSASIWLKAANRTVSPSSLMLKAPYDAQMAAYLQDGNAAAGLTPLPPSVIGLPADQLYQPDFYKDFLANDANPIAALAKENDLIGWKSQYIWHFCVGKHEGLVRPELFFEPLAKEFQQAGSASVSIEDVDPIIQSQFHPTPKNGSLQYHAPGTVVACSVAARKFFDTLK